MNLEGYVPFCFHYIPLADLNPCSEQMSMPMPCVPYRRNWRNYERTEPGIVIGSTDDSRNMRKSYRSFEIAVRLWKRREPMVEGG